MIDHDYEAIIFDNDGVLVEPTDRTVLVDAVLDSFETFGVDADRELAAHTVAENVVPTATVRSHGVDPTAFWHHRELTTSLAQQAHVREGGKSVYPDIDALDELSVPLGLVSNNQHATVEFLLAYHGLDERFDVAIGRRPTLEGAASQKPEPHYIVRALDRLGVSGALYVGDSETDVVAAHRAGIDSAFLRRSHVADVELSVDPTFEITDLHELVTTIDQRAAEGSV
jgi:HAD superfamily hydrolase (TIGR01549 family)